MPEPGHFRSGRAHLQPAAHPADVGVVLLTEALVEEPFLRPDREVQREQADNDHPFQTRKKATSAHPTGTRQPEADRVAAQ